MNKDETVWHFKENKDKYTADMLDDEMGWDNGITLREYIQYGIESEYIDDLGDLSKLSTRELSMAVDCIDYLETK